MLEAPYPGWTLPPATLTTCIAEEFRSLSLWKKDPRARYVIVEVIGAGGGARGGWAGSAASPRTGSGGGAGALIIAFAFASALPATVLITPGLGGSGGPGAFGSAGPTGTSGTASSFGAYLVAGGGLYADNGGADVGGPGGTVTTITAPFSTIQAVPGQAGASNTVSVSDTTDGRPTGGASQPLYTGAANIPGVAGGNVKQGTVVVAVGGAGGIGDVNGVSAGAKGSPSRGPILSDPVLQAGLRSIYSFGGAGSSGGTGGVSGSSTPVNGGDGGDGVDGAGGSGGGGTPAVSTRKGGNGGNGGNGLVRVYQIW